MTHDRIRLVQDVIAAFNAGDDAFVAGSFHPAARIYPESQITGGIALEGPEAVVAWMRGARENWRGLRMSAIDMSEHAGRVVGDALVLGGSDEAGGGWRISFAMWFEDDLISEIRLFWHREDAIAALSN